MASSMWDTLLGGDKPYPVRVGDYCFVQSDTTQAVTCHEIKGTEQCCKTCRGQSDFDGVGAKDITTVLAQVENAFKTNKDAGIFMKANENGISKALREHFHGIKTVGTETEKLVGDLIKYAEMFGVGASSAKEQSDLTTAARSGGGSGSTGGSSSSGSSSSGGGGGSGSGSNPITGAGGGDFEGGGAEDDKKLVEAVTAYLKLAMSKVPGLATPEMLYEASLARKGTYLDPTGNVTHMDRKGDSSTAGASDTFAAQCKDGAKRMVDLQTKLIKELTDLNSEAAKKESDALCGLSCSEDTELDRMMAAYKKAHAQAKTAAGTSGGTPAAAVNCELSDFDGDDTIKLLQQKLKMLQSQSFAFLHAECEATEQCKPHDGKCIPAELIDCSGLYESEMLFNDTHMAAIGQYLAGEQRDGQSPGALGHASRLYEPGTIAPGVNPDELWINVCYRVAGTDDGKDGAVDTMWVRANVCDQRKYETLRAIRKAITEQKRAILALNREILDLQYEVSSAAQGFQSPAAFFSTARRDSAADDSMRTTMAIKHSVARAANSLRRNSDRRRRPQLLAHDGADYGEMDEADDGRGDPKFSRMMRTLAQSVRGRAR